MRRQFFNKTFTYSRSKESEEMKFFRYPANWVAFSWFSGFALVVFFLFKTLITIDAIFHYFLFFGAIATLIHYFLTKPRKPKMLKVMAFYNFFGVAALLAGLFLALNFAFQGPSYEKKIPIESFNGNPKLGGQVHAKEVQFADPNINKFKYFLNFSQWEKGQFQKAKTVKFTFSKGLFGYRIYKQADLSYE